MKIISDGKDYAVKDIANKMNCGISNVSQQLNLLESAGLIKKIPAKNGTCTKIIKPIYEELHVTLK